MARCFQHGGWQNPDMSSSTIEIENPSRQVPDRQAKPVVKADQRWREAFGAMRGEPLLREAAALGAEWRQSENQRR